MSRVRAPAVAGMFYPGTPAELRCAVRGYLQAGAPEAGRPSSPLRKPLCLARPRDDGVWLGARAAPHRGEMRQASGTTPEPVSTDRSPNGLSQRAAMGFIVPHAGYPYSGPVAGTAYSLLQATGSQVRRVVLIGPAHRVPLRGLALPAETAFATPLGEVPLDREMVERTARLELVTVDSEAHAQEHGLEVQLPFLQEVLGDFTLVPLVVGEASAEEVALVLDALWGGPETLVVVSSDLSHYHDYETATRLDRQTSAAIEGLRLEELGRDSACGRVPIQGLLLAARQRGLQVRCLDRRNSGDTAGPHDRVVGYGAYVVH
ncbi:MAG: AmmeMemoRadiSam system protein B [Candidatus Latescibacterota bacterium]